MYVRTVTHDDWNVSFTTGTGIDGAKLTVFRGFYKGRARYGDCNGMMFDSVDSARDFALERGYLQPFRPRILCDKCGEYHARWKRGNGSLPCL